MRCVYLLIMGSLLVGCGDLSQTDFALENGTDEPIYTGWNWLTVTADDSVIEFEESGCFTTCKLVIVSRVACDVAYAPPEPLDAGDSKTFTWDSGHYLRYNEGRDCYKKQRKNRDFEAQFCWSKTLDENGNLESPTCEFRAFEPGDDVTHIVE